MIVYRSNGRLTSTSRFNTLLCSEITPTAYDDHVALRFVFHSGFAEMPIADKYPPLSVSETLSRMRELDLWPDSVPVTMGVLGGKVHVVINGNTYRDFAIMPHPAYRGRRKPDEWMLDTTNILADSLPPTTK